MVRHSMPRHVMSRHATPCHVTPGNVMPRHASPRHARHATPCRAMSRDATPRHKSHWPDVGFCARGHLDLVWPHGINHHLSGVPSPKQAIIFSGVPACRGLHLYLPNVALPGANLAMVQLSFRLPATFDIVFLTAPQHASAPARLQQLTGGGLLPCMALSVPWSV